MGGGALGDGQTSFVARDDRERLFVALAELVVRYGHREVTPESVAQHAGLPPDAFETRFESIDGCMLAAFDAVADQAFAATADAFVHSAGGWPDAVHAALARLLDFLAGSSAVTRMCVVEALQTGTAALARRDRALDRFADFLEPGYELAEPPPPPITSEAVSGSVFELIRGHVADHRLDDLPRALPTATVVALAPFVGPREAERIAARPAPWSLAPR